MASSSFEQRNPYKGVAPRCWVRLRFAAADGTLHEREPLADTGCPCAVILGLSDMSLLMRAGAPSVESNFGVLDGGWLELAMTELELSKKVVGYASDPVLEAAQADFPGFGGLVGLPLLRLVEYGGDAEAFWLRKPTLIPPR